MYVVNVGGLRKAIVFCWPVTDLRHVVYLREMWNHPFQYKSETTLSTKLHHPYDHRHGYMLRYENVFPVHEETPESNYTKISMRVYTAMAIARAE